MIHECKRLLIGPDLSLISVSEFDRASLRVETGIRSMCESDSRAINATPIDSTPTTSHLRNGPTSI